MIEQTGGLTAIVKLTGAQVGVDGAAYATGDVLGDKCPIEIEALRTQAGTGVLQSVITGDLSKQSGAYDIVFFDANPTATTFTDNAALDIADADLPKVIGVVSVVAGDYAAFNDSSVGSTRNIGLPLASNTEPYNKLWVAFVSRDAKTYVADELSVSLGILRD